METDVRSAGGGKPPMNLWIKIAMLAAALPWPADAHAFSAAFCGRALVVGIDRAPAPPFISNKESLQVHTKEGYIVDLLGEIARKLCPSNPLYDTFQFRQADFDELFKRIHIERYDLIAAPLSINAPFRERDNVAYSYPFYRDAGIAVALRKGQEAVANEDDFLSRLQNKTVAVQKETSGHHAALALNEEGYNLNLVVVEQDSELFGVHQAFAIIHDYPFLNFYLKTTPRMQARWGILKIQERVFFLRREQYGFAVAKHHLELLGELNRALTQLENEGKLDRLERCWMEHRPRDCGRRYTLQAVEVQGTVETISKSGVTTAKVDILGTKERSRFVNVDLEGELVSGKCQLWFSGKGQTFFQKLELPRPLCGLRALFVETSTPLADYFWFFPGVSAGYTYKDSSRSVNRLDLSLGIIRGALVTEPLFLGRPITLSVTYNPIGGLYDFNSQRAEFSKKWEVETASPVGDRVNAALTYSSTSPWRNRPGHNTSQTIGLGLKFKFR